MFLIKQFDLEAWKKNSIELARNTERYYNDTLAELYENTEVKVVDGLPPKGLWYGRFIEPANGERPLIEVYSRNMSTEEGKRFVVENMIAAKMPKGLILKICDVMDSFSKEKFFQMYNQSGMDHELIGHGYNCLKKLEFGEEIAVFNQLYLAHERAKKDSDWGRVTHLMSVALNYHKKSRQLNEPKLYLVRHGQTFFNIEHRLGGDSELSPEGVKTAKEIAGFFEDIPLNGICCSTLKRSIQTAEEIQKYHKQLRLIKVPSLVEIDTGDMDSLSYSEFERDFPRLFEARKEDKYHWSFPNGESYETAKERIKPFFNKLKSKNGRFVFVGHQVINRCILDYLLDLPPEEVTELKIPHDVIFEVNLKKQEVSHIRNGQRKKGLDVSYEFIPKE